jgi:hypothetical protein
MSGCGHLGRGQSAATTIARRSAENCRAWHSSSATTNCSHLKGPPHVAASFVEMPAMTELARYLPM